MKTVLLFLAAAVIGFVTPPTLVKLSYIILPKSRGSAWEWIPLVAAGATLLAFLPITDKVPKSAGDGFSLGVIAILGYWLWTSRERHEARSQRDGPPVRQRGKPARRRWGFVADLAMRAAAAERTRLALRVASIYEHLRPRDSDPVILMEEILKSDKVLDDPVRVDKMVTLFRNAVDRMPSDEQLASALVYYLAWLAEERPELRNDLSQEAKDMCLRQIMTEAPSLNHWPFLHLARLATIECDLEAASGFADTALERMPHSPNEWEVCYLIRALNRTPGGETRSRHLAEEFLESGEGIGVRMFLVALLILDGDDSAGQHRASLATEWEGDPALLEIEIQGWVRAILQDRDWLSECLSLRDPTPPPVP